MRCVGGEGVLEGELFVLQVYSGRVMYKTLGEFLAGDWGVCRPRWMFVWIGERAESLDGVVGKCIE